MESELEKAATYYNRAAELRGIAENVRDQAAKDSLIKWAETYEMITGRIDAESPDAEAEPPTQISN